MVFAVVGAGELWETPEGFSKPCGKAEGGRRWPAFHRASDLQPGEEGGRGEERVRFPQACSSCSARMVMRRSSVPPRCDRDDGR